MWSRNNFKTSYESDDLKSQIVCMHVCVSVCMCVWHNSISSHLFLLPLLGRCLRPLAAAAVWEELTSILSRLENLMVNKNKNVGWVCKQQGRKIDKSQISRNCIIRRAQAEISKTKEYCYKFLWIHTVHCMAWAKNNTYHSLSHI